MNVNTFQALDTGVQWFSKKLASHSVLQHWTEVTLSFSHQHCEWFLEISANVIGRMWFCIIVLIVSLCWLQARVGPYWLISYLCLQVVWLGPFSICLSRSHRTLWGSKRRANGFPFFLLLPWHGILPSIFLVCTAIHAFNIPPKPYVQFSPDSL